jgi:glyoxylase I family protein
MTAAPSLHHVLVPARDIEPARRFYRDVLELEEIARPVFPYPGAWFQFGGGQHLHLVVRDDATLRNGKTLDTYDVHFALGMKSYRETLQWLSAKGFRADVPEGDPHKMVLRPDSVTGRPQIYIMDPDQNIVEFICDTLD